MKKYAKENYINNISETISNYENGNSNKTFWQIMVRFMGKSCCSTKIPLLRTDNNEYAYTNEEKSEVLNNFFCTVSTIDDANVNLPNFELRTNNTLSNINILQSEVIDILNLLKVNKAIGPDGISHRMLKYTSKTISVPLTKLFNLSLEQNIYPCKLYGKLIMLCLFTKKKDKSEAANYRPVSLISCVRKAFERVIFKHVYNHIADNNLLYKYQSGFLPGHSTVHHLIEIIHHTCLALENYETSCHIFCDISKAFDRVWHRGLILKLEKYGITGNLLTWFQNYLTMRNQMVFVNGVYSSKKFISAGVPQGSVLGPLLFLIYINDISDDLTGMARLFADDTSLCFSSASMAEIEFVLNNNLEKISNWANKWLITFNALKTEVMLISNVFHDYNFEFKLNNSSLEIVDVHKHLGVYISSDNKWNKHIEFFIVSASKQIAYLRKLKYILPKETLNKLYCTYIRPLLEYVSEVWDGCTITDSNRLEHVQSTAARIVTGLPTFSSLCSLYLETGWKTLAERRRNKKLTLLHKIINNKAPVYLQDLLPDTVGATSSYDLRNSANFEVPFTRLCSFETSFFPSTLKLWNESDLCIRSILSTSQFKSSIRNLPPKPLNYLSAGERKFNIILSRLRHRSSSLKSD